MKFLLPLSVIIGLNLFVNPNYAQQNVIVQGAWIKSLGINDSIVYGIREVSVAEGLLYIDSGGVEKMEIQIQGFKPIDCVFDSNGRIVIAGVTNSFDNVIMCVDENIDTLWTRTFGFTGGGVIYGPSKIINLSDGGYLIIGWLTAGIVSNGYCVKISYWGTMEWSKQFWRSTNNKLNDIISTSSLHVFGGNILNTGFIATLNNNGDVMTSIGIELGYPTTVKSLAQKDELQFYATGEKGNGIGDSSIYTVLMDTNGIINWTKSYTYTGNSLEIQDSEYSDGNLYILASTSNIERENVLLKCDSLGTLIWAKLIDDITATSDHCSELAVSKNKIVLAGMRDGDGYLVHMDTNGWADCHSIEITSDVMLTIETVNNADSIYFGIGPEELAYIPTSLDTITPIVIDACTVGINEGELNTSLHVYPNPSDGLFNIDIPQQLQQEGIRELLVYNNIGSLVVQQPATGTTHLQVDISSQPPGIYLLRLNTVMGVVLGRMVKY